MAQARIWTFDQTEQLLKLYVSEEWQGKFTAGKKSHTVTWGKLAVELTLRPDATGPEAKNRFNNVKKRFMSIRKELSSGAEPPTYEYWTILHKFFSSRPAQDPIARIDSIVDANQDNAEEPRARQDTQEEPNQDIITPASNAKKSASKTSSKKKGKRDLEEEVSDALIKMAKRDEDDTKFQNQLMESMAGFFKVMTQRAQAPAPAPAPQPVQNFSPRTPTPHRLQNFSTPPQINHVTRPWMSPDSYTDYLSSPQPSYNHGYRARSSMLPYSSPSLDQRHQPSAAAGIVPSRNEDDIINVVDNDDEFKTFTRLTSNK